MTLFPPIDLAALAVFAAVWVGYAASVDRISRGRESLDAHMRRYIEQWARQSVRRDARRRVFDTRIVASLQNGAAFFAWTSLLAVGGALGFLHSIGDMLVLAGDLPFATVASRSQTQVKLIGFVLILVYAFFKFAWSYRLFNYAAIMLGGMPPASTAGEPETEAHMSRMVRLCESATRHFSRGQRAVFFALGYLGWFINPYALMAATLTTVVVMWRRQFASDSRRAVLD